MEYAEEFDERGNLIHAVGRYFYEYWQVWDEENRLIYYKNVEGIKRWYRYRKDEKKSKTEITKQKFDEIKEQEFLSREEILIFEIMEL